MNKKNISFIRNFAIIAHIDHGKSTLADCLIEFTKTVAKDKIGKQFLDNLELEKRRGITIKLNYIRLKYFFKDKNEYIFNLIDTPGHIDFTYEVSRSLAACEGAILVVDASKGIQAQTLTNINIAKKNNLDIFAVVNKIDLPQADIEFVRSEIKNIFKIPDSKILNISAKKKININHVLESIVTNIRAPKLILNEEVKALIFDRVYDEYQGILIYVKITSGQLSVNDNIYFINSQTNSFIRNIYIKKDKLISVNNLFCGDVGIISCNIKNLSLIKVGDTITLFNTKNAQPLPGYKKYLTSCIFKFFSNRKHWI